MMKKILICGFAFLALACSKENKKNALKPQEIALSTDYSNVFEKFETSNDTLYVVNFWATWCQPCIEELPSFMKINEEYKKDKKFKMILVSLDRSSDFDTKVKDYISKNNIQPDVYVLSDNKRMNEWIPKINKTWSGALPATALYRNGQQLFFTEGKISYDDLRNTINKFM